MGMTTTDITATLREYIGMESIPHDDGIEIGNDFIDYAAVPFISDPEAWKQYDNEVLYDAEKRLRAWLTELFKTPGIMHSKHGKTFIFKQIFRILYGREYNQKTDGKYTTMLSRLFRYYCSSTATSYYDREAQKTKSKTAFKFSAKRLHQNPP